MLRSAQAGIQIRERFQRRQQVPVSSATCAEISTCARRPKIHFFHDDSIGSKNTLWISPADMQARLKRVEPSGAWRKNFVYA